MPLLLSLALALPTAAQRSPSADRIADLTTQHAPAAFRLYRELLTFPNDANYPDDIARLSEWLEAEFGRRGFAVRRLEMPGSDALLATRVASGATRTVLVYLQADDSDVKLKSRTFSGGTTVAAARPLDSLGETRTGAPIISTLLSMKIGDSFQRMFFTGVVTRPSSMRNVQSRVSPVNRMVRGSTPRMYQKRVSRRPR
jgi:hypothetical protein